MILDEPKQSISRPVSKAREATCHPRLGFLIRVFAARGAGTFHESFMIAGS
jgi:hypothetical protein